MALKSIHEWLEERRNKKDLLNEDIQSPYLSRSLGMRPGASVRLDTKEIKLSRQMKNKLKSIIDEIKVSGEGNEEQVLKSIIKATVAMLQERYTVKLSQTALDKLSQLDVDLDGDSNDKDWDLKATYLARGIEEKPGAAIRLNPEEIKLSRQIKNKLRPLIDEIMSQEGKSEKDVLKSIVKATIAMLQKKYTIRMSQSAMDDLLDTEE